jgi:hypothetical protein
VAVGAVALVIGALGAWSLQSSVPRPGATPVAEPTGAQQRPAAQPRATSSSDVVISAVDPVLWSPGRRARTAATLRHVLTEAPSSATNEPSVHQLLAPRFPHPGTDLSGFGAGAASAAISGMTNERSGTVVIACDRPCILSWKADVVVVSTATAAGRWRTTTTTTQRTATGTAAAFVPLDAALPVPRGASSIDLDIRTQPDVRFLWALHLESG